MVDLLYQWPTWPLVIVLLVTMFLANEIGFRIGHRWHRRESDTSRTVSTALKASVFGLVALLLAFSFSITANRHDMRRRLVLDEANAVGTCYLRADLLDEPYQSDVQTGLRRFVALRLEHFEKGLDDAEFERTAKAMDVALEEVWESVEEAARKNSQSVLVSQIVPAANAVIDFDSTRAWAARSHLSIAVLALLAVCVVVSCLLIGHSSGQSDQRHYGLWGALNVLLVLLMFVVLDFDRPRRGLIQLDHSPLIELQASLNSDADQP